MNAVLSYLVGASQVGQYLHTCVALAFCLTLYPSDSAAQEPNAPVRITVDVPAGAITRSDDKEFLELLGPDSTVSVKVGQQTRIRVTDPNLLTFKYRWNDSPAQPVVPYRETIDLAALLRESARLVNVRPAAVSNRWLDDTTLRAAIEKAQVTAQVARKRWPNGPITAAIESQAALLTGILSVLTSREAETNASSIVSAHQIDDSFFTAFGHELDSVFEAANTMAHIAAAANRDEGRARVDAWTISAWRRMLDGRFIALRNARSAVTAKPPDLVNGEVLRIDLALGLEPGVAEILRGLEQFAVAVQSMPRAIEFNVGPASTTPTRLAVQAAESGEMVAAVSVVGVPQSAPPKPIEAVKDPWAPLGILGVGFKIRTVHVGANDPAEFEIRDDRIFMKSYSNFVPTAQAGLMFPVLRYGEHGRKGIGAVVAVYGGQPTGGVFLGAAWRFTEHFAVGVGTELTRMPGALTPELERQVALEVKQNPQDYPGIGLDREARRLSRPEYYDRFDLTRIKGRFPEPHVVDRYDGAFHIQFVIPFGIPFPGKN